MKILGVIIFCVLGINVVAEEDQLPFPFSPGIEQSLKGTLWALERVQRFKDATIVVNPVIPPGVKDYIKKRDVRSISGNLGYRSFRAGDKKTFKGKLDLTQAYQPADISILVDDKAVLTIKGASYDKTIRVDGSALWRNRSFKTFELGLAPGEVYDLELTYENKANLTPLYNGEIDVDGVSVFVHTTKYPDLVMDLNNNGDIDGEDMGRALKSVSLTSQPLQKEYIFNDDNLSNGLWENGDDDPENPSYKGTFPTIDDDADRVFIDPKIREGKVWVEYSEIKNIGFFTDRRCHVADQVSLTKEFPFVVSSENRFPKFLWVRTIGGDSIKFKNEQVAGMLKVKTSSKGRELESKQNVVLTIVNEIGAADYFHAARDYVFEDNSDLFTRDVILKDGKCEMRICAMAEELVEMRVVESYYDDAYRLYQESLKGAPGPNVPPFEPTKYTEHGLGIQGALEYAENATVAINGNQCDFTTTSLANPLGVQGNRRRLASLTALSLAGEPQLTDKCHGRVYSTSNPISELTGLASLNHTSSTLDDPAKLLPNTHFRGSYLAGDDPVKPGVAGGKYVAQNGHGTFTFGKGRVPLDSEPIPEDNLDLGFDHKFRHISAIGGLSGNYSSADRDNYPNSFVGRRPIKTPQFKYGMVFLIIGKGEKGAGGVKELYSAAKASGVPEIPGATPDSAGLKIIELLMLDSGNTSTAMFHKKPTGEKYTNIYEGHKQRGFPYYTNTFVTFKAKKPR